MKNVTIFNDLNVFDKKQNIVYSSFYPLRKKISNVGMWRESNIFKNDEYTIGVWKIKYKK